MARSDFDLVIIGAGSGGLTAAGFAARLGARVALVERSRIGGDCTWTGCVPSKALLRAARVAHAVRTASRFGISANPPVADMTRVRDYVREAIQRVYRFETPETLRAQGIDVIEGAGRFVDSHTVQVNGQRIRSKAFLLTTGARPRIPPIAGLTGVPFVTYEEIFDQNRLPETMIVVGGGPIGMEMSQAWQRFGARVTMVGDRLLPRDEPEAGELMQHVLEREGVRFIRGRAKLVCSDNGKIVVATEAGEARGDLLFIACGRKPAVAGLDLEKAGVNYSGDGVPVDGQLRTNVRNIYAAGDITGGHQFTHFAGWQAFQAARNALLPGSSSGHTDLVPWVTFTDPEVAHIGLTEEQAHAKFGDDVVVLRSEMSHADRAICEDDTNGFMKIVVRRNGKLLGATVVNDRAGEAITEFIIALKQNMKLSDLAGAIHAYPTYSTPVQQLASERAIEESLSGASGRIIRGLSKISHYGDL
jgi:pyruvate/2-oxoglutarate dehydrogenase complex dihydrolipoamide dehydrogenase (E3) component